MTEVHHKNGSVGNAIKVIGVGLVLSYITATTTWMFVQSGVLSSMQAKIDANGTRIQGMETGRTTPMAAETRAEFNAIWRELERRQLK